MRVKPIIFALVALAVLALASGMATAQQPVVRVLFFYSPTCPHCEAVIKEFIPPLMQKYGPQLEIAFIDISNPQNYEGLLQLEAAYGLDSTKTGVPEAFIGDKVLTGEFAIRDNMESIIQEYLAKGGVDYPSIARINPPEETPTSPAVRSATAWSTTYGFWRVACLA